MSNKKVISETWIRNQVRESIVEELQESLDENVLMDVGKFIGFDKLGKFGDKFLPKVLKGVIIDKILFELSKMFNFEINDGFGLIVKTVLGNMSLTQIGKAMTGQLPCNDVITVFTETANDYVTKLGVRELVAYVLRHYDVNDIMNWVIDYDLQADVNIGVAKMDFGAANITSISPYASDSLKMIKSRNQADQVVNSLIGIVGTQVLENAIFGLLEAYVIPIISSKICEYFKEEDFEELVKDKETKGKISKVAKAVDKGIGMFDQDEKIDFGDLTPEAGALGSYLSQ